MFLVKNRAVNTVRSYIADLQLLYRHAMGGKLTDWMEPANRYALHPENYPQVGHSGRHQETS